ncbi:MAG: AAA family ATPase, partial [Actinomycetes bacterium]
QQEFIQIDTTNVLFIVAGAFAGIEDIVASRVGKKGIGFGADIRDKSTEVDPYSQVQPEDLRKFGLIPEFIGRLPVIANVTPLDRESLMQILTEPKNALVKQYQRMFELDGFELEFEKNALEAMADQAIERETGARGLRAILEEVLGPIMFEIPSSLNPCKVVITRDVVLNAGEPRMVPFKSLRQAKSA